MNGQDDLLSLVEAEQDSRPRKVYATFKTVKIGNAQTIETVKKHHLDFRISHRFGNLYDKTIGASSSARLNNTFQTFFGFDDIREVRFSLDYGITDDITVAVGRNQFNRLLDGSLKYRFLHQNADFSVPVSVALFVCTGYTHDRPEGFYGAYYSVKPYATRDEHRFNYFTQLIIASKLNDHVSLELLPGYLHRNFILERINTDNDAADQNGVFSLGFGGRIKLTKRVSFIGDYFYNFGDFYAGNPEVFNPLALGFELETGGHVFSMFLTNAPALIENNFLVNTTDSWAKGQVKFGFTISRTFAL
jgi:hypothetical protein